MTVSEPIISLDVMGGDFGPSVVIPAAALSLKQHRSVRFLLHGQQDKIEKELQNFPDLKNVCKIHHTDSVIANDEKPSVALRSGRNSSMKKAIDCVKSGDAHGVVSAGNTGALMAMSKMVLRTLPGINRPAIASMMPGIEKDSLVLDLGANLQCDTEALVQFAILGAIYFKTVQDVENPSVGLLNIGSEDMKGPENIRGAAAVLSAVDFPGQFFGFVEGNDIPKGVTDVVVTDGFTGNVALKVAEGVGNLSSHYLKDAFKASLLAKIGAFFAMGSLKTMKKRLDPRLYNGGMFLGLNGICVKSHGGMDDIGFSAAINVAINLVHEGYNAKVTEEIEKLMSQDEFVTALASKVAETQ